jgi:hypothetical protein
MKNSLENYFQSPRIPMKSEGKLKIFSGNKLLLK